MSEHKHVQGKKKIAVTTEPTAAAETDKTAAPGRATVAQGRRASVAEGALPPPPPTPSDASRAKQKRPSWTSLLGAQRTLRGVAITVI